MCIGIERLFDWHSAVLTRQHVVCALQCASAEMLNVRRDLLQRP